MSEKMRLTVESLIATKTNKDKKINKDMYIPSLGGTVLVKKLPNEKVASAMDKIGEDTSISEMHEVFKELIYNSVPLFHSNELLKQYEVVEPFDIVDELLELGEIMDLGNKILEMYGLDKIADEVKN